MTANLWNVTKKVCNKKYQTRSSRYLERVLCAVVAASVFVCVVSCTH